MTRDITHLGNLEEGFKLLVQNVTDYALVILDAAGRVSTWNPGAARIKQYTADEIIGHHFSIFYPPDLLSTSGLALENAAREGRSEGEGWRVRKDGSQFWASVTLAALRDSGGELLGFAKITRDLTAQRAAEEDAHRFRLLIESVKDYAIFILDPSGRISTWNPGAERIKQYKAHEIIGRHFSTFYPPEVAATGKCEFELEVAAREGRFEEEGWRVRKDGTQFWANVTITALRNPQRELVGFAKVTRDLTARREAEESARAVAVQRAALAEKARIQEFQERFLGILGHDLRNPLAALQMGMGLVRQRAPDTATLRILDRVDASAARMSRMIEQILDLTRTRLSDGLELHRAPMDIGASLTAIVEEHRTAHPARGIELSCASCSGWWDKDRLEQVFSNLIGNAIAYGDPGAPVSVKAEHDEQSVRVSVHNLGPPIPSDLQSKLFDPFRRGERESRSTNTAGLGLGLYISRELIVAHGGTLDFESSATNGTTFNLFLPRVEGPPETDDASLQTQGPGL